MEALTRLVTDSLVRHGFDRPIDPRRLQWSRWYPCSSPKSLLVVPSKPGIFAIAEEILTNGGTDASVRPAEQSSADAEGRRMLAVLQFSEDDDMAFTLDRLFARPSPMRDRLTSGRCFLRFVILEDQAQRRSIASALNQWMLSSTEKATGFNFGFEPSPDRVGRTLLSDSAERAEKPPQSPPQKPNISAALNTGAAENLHCPHPLPSGF
jgi:hypothetical protein